MIYGGLIFFPKGGIMATTFIWRNKEVQAATMEVRHNQDFAMLIVRAEWAEAVKKLMAEFQTMESYPNEICWDTDRATQFSISCTLRGDNKWGKLVTLLDQKIGIPSLRLPEFENVQSDTYLFRSAPQHHPIGIRTYSAIDLLDEAPGHEVRCDICGETWWSEDEHPAGVPGCPYSPQHPEDDCFDYSNEIDDLPGDAGFVQCPVHRTKHWYEDPCPDCKLLSDIAYLEEE